MLWETISAAQEWHGAFCHRKKNGEVYWEQASISPIRDSTGRITHYVKVTEDITARRQAEESLRQRTAELQAGNEELDTFAHTVAHDLKYPLSSVLGYAEILTGYAAALGAEQQEEYLRAIAIGARKACSTSPCRRSPQSWGESQAFTRRRNDRPLIGPAVLASRGGLEPPTY